MSETLPPVHQQHRKAFERFVLEQAEPWHREHLTALYTAWHRYNADYFEDRMTPPYILLAEPITPRTFGDTSAATGFGAKLQIRIRPSLVRGTHTMMERGSHDPHGIERFVSDVLLHETIHQYQYEILQKDEASYDGHGPLFRDTANTIGTLLGLPPVRASKVRKAQRELPSCAHWPHNVRPVDYYCGAVYATWQPAPSTEDVLFRKLTRLTRTVDRATLERLCERLLSNKKQGIT
jgi:hypothetical protein